MVSRRANAALLSWKHVGKAARKGTQLHISMVPTFSSNALFALAGMQTDRSQSAQRFLADAPKMH